MFERDWRSSYAAGLLGGVLVVLPAAPAIADSDLSAVEAAVDAEGMADDSLEGESETASAGQGSAGESEDKGPLAKLQIHGFLTQAWADADFVDVPLLPLPDGTQVPLGPSPTGNEQSIGIPEDGTTSYRFIALQFRYEISPKDIFVVQFSSRALGVSPIQDFEDEIELDWAFYERRLTDQTSLKVGRVQIPFGIYNEVRDVGTVLPFYRPAFVRYKEGSFTSETVDGLSLSHTFFAQSDWSLDASIYAGEWESIEFNPSDPTIAGTVTEKDGYGYQLWLNTPLPDLRIGTGLLSFEQGASPTGFEALERRDIYHVSLDAMFDRFTLQAEWDREVVDVSLGGLPIETETENWYVLAGVRVTDDFRIWAQLENAGLNLKSPFFVNSLNITNRDDLGVALNYFFTPTLVLKGEYHWLKEDVFTFIPLSFGPPPLFQGVVETADNGSYTIIALSVSF